MQIKEYKLALRNPATEYIEFMDGIEILMKEFRQVVVPYADENGLLYNKSMPTNMFEDIIAMNEDDLIVLSLLIDPRVKFEENRQ